MSSTVDVDQAIVIDVAATALADDERGGGLFAARIAAGSVGGVGPGEAGDVALFIDDGHLAAVFAGEGIDGGELVDYFPGGKSLAEEFEAAGTIGYVHIGLGGDAAGTGFGPGHDGANRKILDATVTPQLPVTESYDTMEKLLTSAADRESARRTPGRIRWMETVVSMRRYESEGLPEEFSGGFGQGAKTFRILR